MIFGADFYAEFRFALLEECKSLQQRLRAHPLPSLRAHKLQENQNIISHFLASLRDDMTIEKLEKLAKVAPEIDKIVFRGYTEPVFDRTPAVTLIKKMIATCKQAQKTEMQRLSYVAEENNEGKIESALIDNMADYTAITPESKNNNRGQFLNDYSRGYFLDNRDLSHLSKDELMQEVRRFVGIKEPHPQAIQDSKKKLAYDLIINTGQEMSIPFLLDIRANMKINKNTNVDFVDSKAFSFNWRREGEKIFLEIQSDTQILLLSDEADKAMVCTSQGEFEETSIEADLRKFTNRPALISHKYQGEIVVSETAQEARLKTTQYSVQCHPNITYKPEMKNYLEIEPVANVNVKAK